MKNLFGMFDTEENKTKNDDIKAKVVEDRKFLLRKEELDIAKNKILKGDVEVSKEIIEEQKIVDVPITREEVVIERRAVNNEPSDSPIGDEESIRIAVSEEQIEVGKHTVVTGEIAAFKREVVETRQVTETLKREKARVSTHGDPSIIDDEADVVTH